MFHLGIDPSRMGMLEKIGEHGRKKNTGKNMATGMRKEKPQSIEVGGDTTIMTMMMTTITTMTIIRNP